MDRSECAPDLQFGSFSHRQLWNVMRNESFLTVTSSSACVVCGLSHSDGEFLLKIQVNFSSVQVMKAYWGVKF